MNEERLSQLRALQLEVKYRSEEIDYLRSKTGEYVGDTAKDYSTGYGRVIVIHGYTDAQLKRKTAILEKRKAALDMEIEELEKWIESIEDSETRMIFTMRYKDGASWDEVAARLYMSRNTAKKKHDSFLRKK